MTEAKKIRIWNPAVPDTNDSMRNEGDEKPLDFSRTASNNTRFQEIFQSYLQFAPLMFRMQQQKQMEELAKRQFLTTLTITPSDTPRRQIAEPPKLPTNASHQITNPIVANALGSPLINENCCAVCGAAFRLTTDLVQHMRNNHRKSKFKRKSDNLQ